MSFWEWLTYSEDVQYVKEGLYSPLHIGLICFLAIWLVSMFFVFKKYPHFARKMIVTLAIFMIISRLFRMILRICTGLDSFIEAMPWELCHIMCFVISILVLTKAKNFVTPVSVFAFFGGVLTFLFGNYYADPVMSFFDIESIILHICLPTVAIYFLATKQIKYTYKSVTQTLIFLLLLVCYGEVGNMIFPDRNIMFIQENGLPFKIFPGSHIWTYLLLVSIGFGLAYFVLFLKGRIKKKKIEKK